MSAALALVGAVVFGVGDFLGGVAARRMRLLAVLVIAQGIGLAGMALVAVLTGGSPTGEDLGLGALGGLAGLAGVALLYRGLASGAMALVAPITGVVAVIVPVIAGVVAGERPAPLQFAGIGIAVLAVLLLSAGGTSDTRLGRTSLLLAVGAGLGFGLFYIALARTQPTANLWPLVAARGASVTVLVLLSAVRSQVPRLQGTPAPIVIGCGVFDVSANALYLLAVRGGLLSIVAVLISLYPVSTVVCSVVFLGERLRRSQVGGVAAATAAAVLITAG